MTFMNASKINEYIFLEEKKMSEKIMDMENFKTNKKKFNKNKKRFPPKRNNND